ncbi:MAG: hypothetical protein A4E49_01378 [Methanosaeta sp. PtaU1.Bin112]|nr:MAG: hypothetical protein A4E49_01378 [Methanosaeta sp. PtaU1.Bin112]
MSNETSDEKVRSSICPAMGVCHLETGVQVIIPMQMGPEKIIESLEAIVNAVKSNTAEGIGCYPIACMMSEDVGAMLAVSTDAAEGMPEALDALLVAAMAFAEGAGNAKAKLQMQDEKVSSDSGERTP